MQFFVPAIANATSAVLVGETLAADPEWIRQTREFAVNRYKSADDVRKWPPYLAAVVASWIPSVRRMRQSRAYVKEKMAPLYEDLQSRGLIVKSKFRKGLLGYGWLWAGTPNDVTLEEFSDAMMRTIIAAIHTTAKTILLL